MLEYDELTIEQRAFFDKFIWNGVGSRSYWLNPRDFIFKEASKYHDFAYFRGGPDSLRRVADKDFFHRAHSAVRKQKMWKRPFYYLVSYIYFVFLKKFGKAAWEYYDKPADTWEEYLRRVNNFFDRNPNRKDRPPIFQD